MGALNSSRTFVEFLHHSPGDDSNGCDGDGIGGGYDSCGYGGCGVDVVINLLFIECHGCLLGCSWHNCSSYLLSLKIQPAFPADPYIAKNPFLSLAFFIPCPWIPSVKIKGVNIYEKNSGKKHTLMTPLLALLKATTVIRFSQVHRSLSPSPTPTNNITAVTQSLLIGKTIVFCAFFTPEKSCTTVRRSYVIRHSTKSSEVLLPCSDKCHRDTCLLQSLSTAFVMHGSFALFAAQGTAENQPVTMCVS